LLRLQANKHGVNIMPVKSVDFSGVRLGSSLARNMDVENNSDRPVCLKSVHVEGDSSVCAFRVELERKEAADIIVTLMPHDSYTVRVSVNSISM